jgi:hypothetical protein
LFIASPYPEGAVCFYCRRVVIAVCYGSPIFVSPYPDRGHFIIIIAADAKLAEYVITKTPKRAVGFYSKNGI